MQTRIIAALASVFSLCFLFANTVKRNIMFFPTKLEEDVEMGLIDEVAYEKVKCLGDAEIYVYYRKEPDPSKPFVLYAHGTSDVIEFNMDFFRQSFPHVNLIAHSYRGYGRSEGQPNVYAASLDMVFLLSWMQEKFRVKPEDVLLFGRSIGTQIVGQLIGNTRLNIPLPKKVVLFTPFARYTDVLNSIGFPVNQKVMRTFVRFLTEGGDLEIDESLKHYLEGDEERSLFILAVKGDKITPTQNSIELYDHVKHTGRCLYKEINGFHHMNFSHFNLIEEFYYDAAEFPTCIEFPTNMNEAIVSTGSLGNEPNSEPNEEGEEEFPTAEEFPTEEFPTAEEFDLRGFVDPSEESNEGVSVGELFK